MRIKPQIPGNPTHLSDRMDNVPVVPSKWFMLVDSEGNLKAETSSFSDIVQFFEEDDRILRGYIPQPDIISWQDDTDFLTTGEAADILKEHWSEHWPNSDKADNGEEAE